MEKIKCYRLIEARKYGGYIGHIIPEGKAKQAAIIMVPGETEEKTHKALDQAAKDAPDKYKAKYEF